MECVRGQKADWTLVHIPYKLFLSIGKSETEQSKREYSHRRNSSKMIIEADVFHR